MTPEHLARRRHTARLHLAMEAEETLRRVGELPGRCAALGYFEERLRDHAQGRLPDTGRKLMGVSCIQVPRELIRAVGAHPVRLCEGSHAFDQAGAEALPARSCPVTRATRGRLQADHEFWSEALAALVVPLTCDHKRKMAEQLEGLGYRVIPLEMPATRESELAVAYWQESVKVFAAAAEEVTGVRLTRQRLQQAVAEERESCRLLRLLQKLRRQENPPLYGVDMFLVTSCFFFDDPGSWQAGVRALLAEAEAGPAGGGAGPRNAPRIVFTGSPPIFPNLKVPLLVEESGGLIVADETCSGARMLYDVAAPDGQRLHDLLPAVADRYLKPCTCPCFTPNPDRGRKLLNLAADGQADGVVYQAFSGCAPYELEQRPVGDLLTGSGLPVLNLETDYSPEDTGQLATRIEAFLESLAGRRRRSGS